jgi:hypothetical protein
MWAIRHYESPARQEVMRLIVTRALVPLSSVALLSGGSAIRAVAQQAVLQSFRAQIALESVGSPRISPDGSMIAYSVTTTDWEENRFDRKSGSW